MLLITGQEIWIVPLDRVRHHRSTVEVVTLNRRQVTGLRKDDANELDGLLRARVLEDSRVALVAAGDLVDRFPSQTSRRGTISANQNRE